MKQARGQPKSMITAVIRVTSVNKTKSGVVSYNQEEIGAILEKWSSNGLTYWFIKHDPCKENNEDNEDEELKEHFHIVIRFKKPMPFKSIKDRFPYGKIESAKKIQWAVQYLIHANDKTKEQYAWESIITNCDDLNLYKPDENAITLESVLAKIDKGEILAHTYHSEIPIELYSKHKTQIKNAFEYVMERFCMDKNRDIIVKFMSGASGLGKTTFAKWYCDKKGLTYFVSSASNDPMEGYRGERVLILDDLRDDSFRYADMLKLLDNHTRSSSKSRYSNKMFVGDTIIITSTVPLNEWYKSESIESRRQLSRRIVHMYEFDDKFIYSKEYDEEKCDYIPTAKIINFVKKELQRRKDISTEMFDVFGMEVEKIDSDDLHKAKVGLAQTKLIP
jgi:Plasmid replication protein/RNA helicase